MKGTVHPNTVQQYEHHRYRLDSACDRYLRLLRCVYNHSLSNPLNQIVSSTTVVFSSGHQQINLRVYSASKIRYSKGSPGRVERTGARKALAIGPGLFIGSDRSGGRF